jgi:hypothetical protein
MDIAQVRILQYSPSIQPSSSLLTLPTKILYIIIWDIVIAIQAMFSWLYGIVIFSIDNFKGIFRLYYLIALVDVTLCHCI